MEERVEEAVEPTPTEVRVPDAPWPTAGASSRRARVWAVGDGDGGPASRALARTIASDRPDLFLYLGDVYPKGTSDDFEHGYAPSFGALTPRTAPTPGNHDWPEADEGYGPYWRRASGRVPASFYALTAGGWDVLSLNSEAPHGPGSVQGQWLRDQVRRRGTCRLAFWHQPRYSAGVVHGDAPGMEPLWHALGSRARLVLNGHDHDSQRLRAVDGITELVAGAGGHGLYPVRADSRLAFANDSDFSALRLDLVPGRASFAFVTATGRVLDRGHVRCRPRGPVGRG